MTPLWYRQFQRKALLAKWSKVDWSKQDCELADETGLSNERIRQVRQRLGVPKSARSGQLRKPGKRLLWAKENLEKLKGLTGAELQRKYGPLHFKYNGPVHRFLRPFLRDGRRFRQYPWHLMNLGLPNRDLERIWRVRQYEVARHRWLKRSPAPMWHVKPGPWNLQYSGRRELQAYRRALRAEERNAARYFAQA
jgi:hypothetical protein